MDLWPRTVEQRTVLVGDVGKLLRAKTMVRSELSYLVRLAFAPETWSTQGSCKESPIQESLVPLAGAAMATDSV